MVSDTDMQDMSVNPATTMAGRTVTLQIISSGNPQQLEKVQCRVKDRKQQT